MVKSHRKGVCLLSVSVWTFMVKSHQKGVCLFVCVCVNFYGEKSPERCVFICVCVYVSFYGENKSEPNGKKMEIFDTLILLTVWLNY